MGPHALRLRRGFDVSPRCKYLSTLDRMRPNPISGQWMGVGYPHHVLRYRLEGSLFLSPSCCICIRMEILIGTWDIVVSGLCSNIDVGPRGHVRSALALRTPPNKHLVGAGGASIPCGAVAAKRITFFVPGFWSRKCMEVPLTRGWDLIFPWCGGTPPLAPWENLATLWLHELQPISNHPMRWGFHTVPGGVDQGDHRLRPWAVGVEDLKYGA